MIKESYYYYYLGPQLQAHARDRGACVPCCVNSGNSSRMTRRVASISSVGVATVIIQIARGCVIVLGRCFVTLPWRRDAAGCRLQAASVVTPPISDHFVSLLARGVPAQLGSTWYALSSGVAIQVA